MTITNKAFIIIGALSLTLATMLSAYGFHGLAGEISAAKQASWGWAVQIQSYHSLGLILVAALSHQWSGSMLLKGAGALIIAGMLIFSGSIYAEILGAPEAIGEIAPYGGTSIMLAWALVALAALLTPRAT
jgi:uncharacterized membrane protein YgdD (TMEM256/DUF423 family)